MVPIYLNRNFVTGYGIKPCVFNPTIYYILQKCNFLGLTKYQSFRSLLITYACILFLLPTDRSSLKQNGCISFRLFCLKRVSLKTTFLLRLSNVVSTTVKITLKATARKKQQRNIYLYLWYFIMCPSQVSSYRHVLHVQALISPVLNDLLYLTSELKPSIIFLIIQSMLV